jgi:formate hydrogenlyase subunit 6/NADH:ubiquinone oxidoreductase subunit I
MKAVTQAELNTWLNQLASQQTLVAPCDSSGLLLFRPVKDCSEVNWRSGRTVMSAKEYLFPHTERLLRIEKMGQEVNLVEMQPDEKIVLFGLHPCDARGMQLLDALFLEKPPQDAYYARRRNNMTLIGMACESLGESCFCTTMGGAMDDPSGMDVMVSKADRGYTIQAVTSKGKALLDAAGLPYTQATVRSEEARTSEIPPIEAWPEHFMDAYWRQISERCLSCRVCAYVCPTCRCFDVRDEQILGAGDGEYERIRCWDSCNSVNYRRVAGGHNPRLAKTQRLRNRFYCKFYYFPHQYGPINCTGCGRCVDACPVNVDITEVIQQVYHHVR